MTLLDFDSNVGKVHASQFLSGSILFGHRYQYDGYIDICIKYLDFCSVLAYLNKYCFYMWGYYRFRVIRLKY